MTQLRIDLCMDPPNEVVALPGHDLGLRLVRPAVDRKADEETGSEDAAPLRAFLDDLKHPNIKLNFDPANMTMRGWDVANCVKLLAKDFAHTHAKDATFKGGEQPLGAGDINWPQYMAQMKKAGYTGSLVIEREGGNAFWSDVAQGLTLLRKWRAAV